MIIINRFLFSYKNLKENGRITMAVITWFAAMLLHLVFMLLDPLERGSQGTRRIFLGIRSLQVYLPFNMRWNIPLVRASYLMIAMAFN